MEAQKSVKYSSFMNENYKNKLTHSVYYLVVALYFFLLVSHLHYFTWSDQYLYRLHYDGLEMRNFLEGFDFYVNTVGAREPVYFFFTYILQHVMPKHWFDILLSCIFFGVLFFYFHKFKTPKTIVAFIITGIYFFSVFFITERLKLGVIFLLFYFLYSKQRFSFVLILLAILSHAQLLILLPFLFSSSNFKINNRKVIALLLLFLIVVGVFLFQHLAHKLPIYLARCSFFNMIKPLFFGLITFSFMGKEHKREFFSLFIPVIVVALFFGDGRMTSFAFLGSIYFWTIEKKVTLWSSLLFLSCCYFSLRGLVLLLSATLYGDGYAIGILDVLKMIK